MQAIERAGEQLRIASGSCCERQSVLVDELVVATGLRPDHSFLRELRLALDPALECPPALAPLIDPNLHSCGTVRPHGARELAQPEPGLYLAGMKSYGRAPTFLMITGYEQVRSIVADIAGDRRGGTASRTRAAGDRRVQWTWSGNGQARMLRRFTVQHRCGLLQSGRDHQG